MMPRFFFDFQDRGCAPGDEGVELPDRETAKEEALCTLSKIAADEAARGDHRHQFFVVVSDEDRQPIYAATLTSAGVWLR